MNKIRIGILCPSEIAFRRFLPALFKQENFEYIGVAYANEKEWFGAESVQNDHAILLKEKEKAERFATAYGGAVIEGYEELINLPNVDAVYLPLPPALHFKWGQAVLEQGKHLFMEKPFTTSLEDTNILLKLAQEKQLAVHENYMFQYHSQLEWIQQALGNNLIGALRLLRVSFGFPFRGNNDFRYNKALGGGALLDCGGYTVKLASMFLGETAQVHTSQLNFKDGVEVDLFGSATMVNAEGTVAQISFGMDNSYKCELELWGSTGTLYTNRVLTAPDGFEPTITIKYADSEKTWALPADDSFQKSMEMFKNCVTSETTRANNYAAIRKQAEHVEAFKRG